MILRITNYCTMGCPHCMMESDSTGGFMDKALFLKALKFAKLAPKTSSLQLSGGEPTFHPDILEYLELSLELCKQLDIPLTLITNGEFLINPELKGIKDKIIKMVIKNAPDFTNKKIPSIFGQKIPQDAYSYKSFNFFIQITSVPGIYKNHEERVSKMEEELEEYYDLFPEIKDNISITTSLDNGIIPIGRAKKVLEKDPYYFKKLVPESSMLTNIKDGVAYRKSTSCFNLYNILQHMDGKIFRAIDYMKSNTVFSLCKPLITEKGEIKFGEYESCSSVLNLNDISIQDIIKMEDMQLDISQVMGPCRECINNESMESLLDQYITKYKEVPKLSKDI